MKKIKKTLSVTLLMLGLVSIGAGAGVATNSVSVDPIKVHAELYPDWTCAVNKLGATDESTSSVIYGEVLEGDTVDELDEESLFTLHEGSGEGFALNGVAFTPAAVLAPAENVVYIDLGFEAQAGDVVTVNGAFSNEDWEMTIEFNNCALVFDGSAWVAQGDAPVTPEVPDGYTTHTIGKLTFHVNSTIGPASGSNNQLYLQREDGEALPIQDWGVFFTHESGEGFKINGEAATANEIKSTDGGFFLLFNELQPGDVVSISGTFVCEAEAVKYVIEESAFTWTGSKWEKYVAYTEYNLGAVVSIADGTDSNGYCTFTGVNLPISSWDYAFDYVSGNGITVDGTMISMVNSVKSVGGKLFVDLGASANVDSVLKIGGVFSNTATAVKYIIEDSEFKWDGSAWVPLTEVEIQYTTYTINKLEGANGCAADTIYTYPTEGDALPGGDWDNRYALESGEGLKLNGETITDWEIKQPGDLYIKLSAPAVEGDVLTIDGTFYNEVTAKKFVFTNCELTFNGTTWVAEAEEVPPAVDYTTHEIGKLTFHNNSTIGPASGLNNQLYLQREDGEALPVQSWDVLFTHESGEGFKINGEAATAAEIKSTGDGFFWKFNELQPGDSVSISGTFVCEAEAVKYVIEESAFTWTGSKWENYVAYTTYTINKLEGANNCEADTIYTYPTEGDALPGGDWDNKFELAIGEGLKLNGETITGWEFKQPGDFYIKLSAPAVEGDVLTIDGIFYNAMAAKRFVINNCELTFNGTTWKAEAEEEPEIPEEPEVEYTTYTITKLEGANNCEPSVIFAYSAAGDTLPGGDWDNAYTLESGAGLKLNDTVLEVWEMKQPGDFYFKLSVDAVEGDKLTIEGTFINETTAKKFVITNCILVFDGTTWKAEAEEEPEQPEQPEEVEYTTYTITKLEGANGCEPSVIFAYSAAGDTLPSGDWDNAYTLESGAGLKLNDTVLEVWEMKQPGDLYFKLSVDAVEGDKLTIDGTFINETTAKKFVITNCVLVFDGTTWKAEAEEEPEQPEEVEYTTYTITKLEGASNCEPSVIFAYSAAGDTLPSGDWDNAYTLESGAGLKLNDTVLEVWEMKQPGDFYFKLSVDAVAGDKLTIDGTFINETTAKKFVITNCVLVFDGTTWKAEAGETPSEPSVNPDDPTITYTEYNLGAVIKATGSAQEVYFVFANGVELPISSWDDAFAHVSGNGITVDGTMIGMTNSVKSVGGKFFANLGAEATKGAILKIGGVFSNNETAVKYIIEDTEFKWNGLEWVDPSEPDLPDEPITVEIGKLELHNNSSFGAASTTNGVLYLQRVDGEALPVVSWDVLFTYVSGNGFQINGQTVIPGEIKSTDAGFYLTFDALNAGDVVTISGTFECAVRKMIYVIEESKFVWTGSGWDPYVEYTTYNVGTLVFGSGSATEVYLDRADGEEFVIVSTENDINWEAAFKLRNGSGAGITLNGVQISMVNSVKFPSNMYIALGATAKEGDILVVGGTFYNVELAVEYVITENEFVFDGTTWTDLLTGAKNNAKAELDAYVETLSKDNYYDAQWTELNKIVEDAKASIDTAGAEADLAPIVTKAKGDMNAVLQKAAVDELLSGVRESAKADLAAYKNQADYKDAGWAEIEGIIANANATIDATYTEADIAAVVEAAKEAMDAVQTAAQADAAQLKAWRESAKADVQAYYGALNFKLYSAEANATISGYVSTAMSAIEAATTKEAIDAAVAQFKANVGKVEKLPTDKPADSSTSQNSSTPDESVADESVAGIGGCFSVVGGSVALSGLGLAAAAIVALRKKEDEE